MVSSHGLSASIRSAQESDTFDLAGLSVDAISSAIESAFAEPLPLLVDALSPSSAKVDTVRLTFVVGAGKQARQRYDDGLAKAVTCALERCGYVEDRSGGRGTYKMQHDTGKNLKTVVVCPFVANDAKSGSGGNGDDDDNDEDGTQQTTEGLIPKNSPGYKIAISSVSVFQGLLSSQCPSWSEKRECLESLTALNDLLAECDSKLIKGVPLDRAEQSFYDAVVDLDDKAAYVKQEVHRMVDSGQVTKYERDMMLEQNAERIASLKREGKSTTKAEERREMLEGIDPQPPHRLRHEAAIVKLHKELAPLVRMEDAARGRLLSVRETQTLARKEEIVDEISYLEESSQGWFEDDDAFEFRLRAARVRYEGRSKAKGGGGGGGGGGRVTANAASLGKIRAPAPTSRWVTPGSSQGWGKAGGAGGMKKKKKGKGGAVFTAMMVDSDSDDDEDESVGDNNEYEDEEDQKVDIGARNRQEAAKPIASAKKKSRNKKKKKKKGGGSGGG